MKRVVLLRFSIVVMFATFATRETLADELTLLDGAVSDLGRLSLHNDTFSGETGSSVPLDNVLSIHFAAPIPTPPKSMQLLLHGGLLFPDKIALANEQLELVLAGAPVTISVDDARGICLQAGFEADWKYQVSAPAEDVDRFLVRADSGVDIIRGLLEGIDEESVSLNSQGESRRLERGRVVGIVLAKTGFRGKSTTLSTRDGQVVPGRLIEMSHSQILWEFSRGQNWEIARQLVSRIDFQSPRLTFLSDIETILAEEEPLFTAYRPFQRDRSVLGRTLTHLGKSYSKGIGVHSQSKLEVSLNGAYSEFVSGVGIDDETNGLGDCEFVVLVDGREVSRHRVRGREPWTLIRVDLSGAQTLALIVEAGADQDFGDHADWLQARLLKPAQAQALNRF